MVALAAAMAEGGREGEGEVGGGWWLRAELQLRFLHEVQSGSGIRVDLLPNNGKKK